MNEAPKLTLDYLEYAPDAAARVLQEIEATDAAAYLDGVPGRLAAPVLAAMAPWAAARCMGLIAPVKAAAICRRLGFAEAVGLLRLTGAEARERLFEEMPGRQAQRLRSALRYPLGQVGAWADPEVPVIWSTATVRDALRLLKQSPAASHLFLESEDEGRFCGAVPIRELLDDSPPTQRLSELTCAQVAPLSNRAALVSVVFDERWDDFLHLPVVGRSGAVLGGLSRRALREGMRAHHERDSASGPSVPEQMLGALGVVCVGLMRLLVHSNDRGPYRHGGALDGTD